MDEFECRGGQEAGHPSEAAHGYPPQMEASAEEARTKEAAEVARGEKELARLDKQIGEMRKRLGSSARGKEDSLETLLAMVRQKEDQARKLEELERKRKEEEKKRRAELRRLKEEQWRKQWQAFEADLQKDVEIPDSKYGIELTETAWKSLISRYPKGRWPAPIDWTT